MASWRAAAAVAGDVDPQPGDDFVAKSNNEIVRTCRTDTAATGSEFGHDPRTGERLARAAVQGPGGPGGLLGERP
jgi:hypothetical protein